MINETDTNSMFPEARRHRQSGWPRTDDENIAWCAHVVPRMIGGRSVAELYATVKFGQRPHFDPAGFALYIRPRSVNLAE
jgi:hypothetical protein